MTLQLCIFSLLMLGFLFCKIRVFVCSIDDKELGVLYFWFLVGAYQNEGFDSIHEKGIGFRLLSFDLGNWSIKEQG